MIDEKNPVYWEPYTLEVGQRVRVRLSAECPLRANTLQLPGQPASTRITTGHPVWVDGRVGRVSRCEHQPCPFERYGHTWVVRLRDPSAAICWLTHFALAELEPLHRRDLRRHRGGLPDWLGAEGLVVPMEAPGVMGDGHTWAADYPSVDMPPVQHALDGGRKEVIATPTEFVGTYT